MAEMSSGSNIMPEWIPTTGKKKVKDFVHTSIPRAKRNLSETQFSPWVSSID